MQSNNDFQFRLIQQSDLNEYFVTVTGYVILEVCFSTGTQLELSRIGNNFAKANNWRWYPWSVPSGNTGLAVSGNVTGVPIHMRRETRQNVRTFQRKESIMIDPEDLADSVSIPLSSGGLTTETGSGGEVKDEGNPNYYVADGMSQLQ